eukprot:8608844-Pyramimonas_sp.AAC.1
MRSDSVCASSFLSWMWCAEPLSRTQERVGAAVDRGGSTVGAATDSWIVSSDSVVKSREPGIAAGVATDTRARRSSCRSLYHNRATVGNIEELEHSVSTTTVGPDLVC